MIAIDAFDLLTLGTTTSISSNDGIHISNDELATTLTSSITTGSTGGGPGVYIHASAARDYVTSMSVEERDDLVAQIDERIAQLSNVEIGPPKVKTLGAMENRKI